MSEKSHEKPADLLKRLQEMEHLLGVISRGKHMWQSTFDAITMPVHIVDVDYHIERANVSVTKVGGGKITQYPGKLCYEIFAGRAHPCEGCPLPQALKEAKPVTSLLAHPIHDALFEVSAYPYDADEKGKQRGIVSYRDISEERRLHREVLQQEKMAAIGILAGGVAHEINNPLGGILAFAQLLLKEVKDNEMIRGDLEEILHAAERCKKIVANLLDFSRTSSEGDKRSVDLPGLLEKILPFIRGEMRSLNVDLHITSRGQIPSVWGLPDQLQQVFLNLLTNACHAMSKGGEIHVEFSRGKNGGACAAVRDGGVGIPEKIVDRIFDPFFTTKEPGKGTGLGLSICYRIVREHGGKIEVQSREGKGTMFILHFPPPSLKEER